MMAAGHCRRDPHRLLSVRRSAHAHSKGCILLFWVFGLFGEVLQGYKP